MALRFSLVVALAATVLSPTGSSAAPACASSQWFDVYRIRMEPDRKVYRFGDTAVIAMEVTDSTTGAPVSDADVAAGAVNGDGYASGMGKTNAAGKAKVNVKLTRRYLSPGWVQLRGMARTYHDEGEPVCGGVGFYGYDQINRAFRIKR